MSRPSTDTPRGKEFATEAAMVEQFIMLLHDGASPWGVLETTTEWDYRTGITDVLVRTFGGQLVAFEAKLTDWRRASRQAYRNTTFAGRTYVVMPSMAAERIKANEQVFARYGIGLCSLDADRIEILIEAPAREPLLPWLHERAQSFFDAVSCDRPVTQPRKCRHAALQAA